MRKLTMMFGLSVLLAGFAPALHAQTAASPVDAGKGVIDEAKPAIKATLDKAVPAKTMAAKPKKMAKSMKKAKAMKKPKAVKMIVVKVTNARDVPVTSLSLTISGMTDGGTSLKQPLAPGKEIKIKLNAKKSCTYDVRGSFEDDAVIEADSIDFCADATLVLKD